MDVLKKCCQKSQTRDRFYNQYHSNISQDYICSPRQTVNEDGFCSDCRKLLVQDPVRGLLIREGCGRSAPLVDRLVETSQNEYKRYDYFCDWLANFRGKENIRVPKEIIDAVIHESTKIGGKLTEDGIRLCLKKIGRQRYYNHVAQILFRITNVPPLQMTSEMEWDVYENSGTFKFIQRHPASKFLHMNTLLTNSVKS